MAEYKMPLPKHDFGRGIALGASSYASFPKELGVYSRKVVRFNPQSKTSLLSIYPLNHFPISPPSFYPFNHFPFSPAFFSSPLPTSHPLTFPQPGISTGKIPPELNSG